MSDFYADLDIEAGRYTQLDLEADRYVQLDAEAVIKSTPIQKAGQAVKEAVAAPVRTIESMMAGAGGLMRMGAETATIGEAITKHVNIPGASAVAEHIIRKYGPKKALSFYDARMKQYAGMGKKVSDFWEEQAGKGWEAPNPEITEARWRDRPASKTVSAVSSGLTSIGIVVGTSFLTKSPHAGLAILASSETGSMYDRLRKKNVSPNVASKLAQLAGAWTYATEKIGFDKLLAPAKKTIMNTLKKSGWEGAQEVIETMGHNLLEYFGYDYKDLKSIPTAVKSAFDHIMDGWMDALVGGIGAGGIASVALPGPAKPDGPVTTPPTVEEVTGKTTEEIEAAKPAAELADLGLKEQPPAPTEEVEKVFHGTSIKSAEQIRKTGFKAGTVDGMTSQPIKEFVFVTPHKAGAKWYGEQNIRFKGKYDIVEAGLSGKLYEVKKPTNEYGAMGIFAKDVGLMAPAEHKLDLPAIANKLRELNYAGIKFKDSVSNRMAYAVLPEQLKVTKPTPTLKETQAMSKKPKRMTRKKGFREGHDIPNILGWAEDQRRDFMEETIGVRSMGDISKGKKGMDQLRTLTDALNQKMQEAGLVYEAPTLPTKELIETLEETKAVTAEDPIRPKNRRWISKLVDNIEKKTHTIGGLLYRLERFFESLDGRKDGIFRDTFWTPVNDASNEINSTVNQEAGVFMSELENQDIDTVQWMGVKDVVPGTNIELTATQRIGVYMKNKNKRGLERLIGMGFATEDITAIIKSMSDQEVQVADQLLEDGKAWWPIVLAAAAQSNIDLKTLKKEFAYSMILDTDTDLIHQEDFLSDLAEPFRREGHKPEAGMLEKRKKGVTGPIELDAFVVHLHTIARVQRFITMAPLANRLSKILNNKGFKQTLNERTYGQGSKLINSWLKDSIKGSSAESTTLLSKTLAIMRINGIVYAIGYNIPSSLRQTLSGLTAIAVDPLMMKYMPMNILRAMTPSGYKTMEAFVYDRAPAFKHRNMDRDIRRRWNKITLKRNLTYTDFGKRMKKMFGALKEGDIKTAYMYYKSGKPFSQSALRWIKFMDKHTVVTSWKSLYDTAIEKGSDKADAIKYASKWVGRTQPMGDVQHLPQFFRDGPLEKLLSTFNNFINQYGNFYYHDIYQAKKKGEIGMGTVAHRVMWSYVLPAILFGMIGRARLPKDWKEIGIDLGTYPIMPIMLIGRLIDRMIRGWGNSGTIATVGVESAVGAGRAAMRGDIKRAILGAVKAIAAIKGVPPTAQMIRTTEGAIDLAAGTTQDPRRLIYSQWALDQGKESTPTPHGRRRAKRVRPRKVRARR